MILLGRAARATVPIDGLILMGWAGGYNAWVKRGARFIEVDDASTPFTNPAYPVAIHPDGEVFLLGRDDSPYIQLGAWDGAEITNISPTISALPGTTLAADWHPTDSVIPIVHFNGVGISLYEWDGVDFNELTEPTTPGGTTRGVRWSPSGAFLALARGGTDSLTFYTWDGSNLTRLPINTTTWSAGLAGGGNSVDWHPDSERVYFGCDGSPYVEQYTRSGNYFTKQSAPGTIPGAAARVVKVSPTGSHLVVGSLESSGCIVYSISGTTLTALSPPAGGYQTSPQAVAWVSDTEFVLSGFDEAATTMHRVVGASVETVGSFDVTPASNIQRNAIAWSPI